MNKKFATILFLLFFSFSIQGQEVDSRKYINKVHKKYVSKLKLDSNQSKEFKTILKKYNPIIKDLIDKKSSKKKINSQIKLMDLAVYKLVNKEQFTEYKKIKLKLETFKNNKF